MTLENYHYRNSPLFLRNQFEGAGKFNLPVIPKAAFHQEDFNNLRLIGYDRVKADKNSHRQRMVHFFLYDYRFESVWDQPERAAQAITNYRAALSPDFSMYLEMNPALQLYNTFRNRWCGAYFASKGIRVIPTVSWGDENTFGFCFDGIPRGSVVAVSTYMVSQHGNHREQKEFFLKGYNEMLRRIVPEKIICYHTPFPEMQGDIVFIDYDLSSWRHMEEDRIQPSSGYVKYPDKSYPHSKNRAMVMKRGYVLSGREERKGMGSAGGGGWRPKKDTDKRFLGKPGEIKSTDMDNGDNYQTKIGDNGKAERERHNTHHNRQHTGHTNPHDHKIGWGDGFPELGPPINYPDGYIPEFKHYRKEGKSMCDYENWPSKIVLPKDYDMDFESISDFKWCMRCGGEVQFKWNDLSYGIVHDPDAIAIYQANMYETERLYATVDELLDHKIGEDKLRDIITKVKVIERTI